MGFTAFLKGTAVVSSNSMKWLKKHLAKCLFTNLVSRKLQLCDICDAIIFIEVIFFVLWDVVYASFMLSPFVHNIQMTASSKSVTHVIKWQRTQFTINEVMKFSCHRNKQKHLKPRILYFWKVQQGSSSADDSGKFPSFYK